MMLSWMVRSISTVSILTLGSQMIPPRVTMALSMSSGPRAPAFVASRTRSVGGSFLASKGATKTNGRKTIDTRVKMTMGTFPYRHDPHFQWESPSKYCRTRLLSSTSSSSSIYNDPKKYSDNWETIASTKNPIVKTFKTLLSKKKARYEQNTTVVEGHRFVMDLVSNPHTSMYMKHILVTKQALDQHELYDLLLSLSKPKTEIKITIVTETVLQACCDTITPQGVVATCTIPKPFSIADVPSTPNSNPSGNSSFHKQQQPSPSSPQQPQLYLVLDGVSDPGNVGTLLRSAAAVGVTAVLLLPHCTDVWSPKALRSSMGASFHVPVLSVASFEECCTVLEACGCRVKHDFYAATMEANSNGYDNRYVNNETPENGMTPAILSSSPAHYEIDWVTRHPLSPTTTPSSTSKISALCIGKEGSGLSLSTRNAVLQGDIQSVHVPMVQTGAVESLNAAVCGSVILFEHSRQKWLSLKGKS